MIGKQIECQLASNLSRFAKKAVTFVFLSEAPSLAETQEEAFQKKKTYSRGSFSHKDVLKL